MMAVCRLCTRRGLRYLREGLHPALRAASIRSAAQPRKCGRGEI
jgi:hypothetical protein